MGATRSRPSKGGRPCPAGYVTTNATDHAPGAGDTVSAFTRPPGGVFRPRRVYAMSSSLSHFLMTLVGAAIGIFVMRCMYGAPVMPEQAPASEEKLKPLDPWKPRDLRKRKGVVILSRVALVDRVINGTADYYSAAYAALMRDFVILEAKPTWDDVEYFGCHPAFAEVEEGMMPPRYEAQVYTSTENGPGGVPVDVYTVKFVRTS